MDKSLLFHSRWLVDLVLMFSAGVLFRMSGLPRGRIAMVASVVQIAAPVGIIAVCYLGGGQFMVALLALWIWSLSADRGPGVWFFSLRFSQIAGLSSYSLYMLHWVILGYGTIVLVEFRATHSRYLPIYVLGILVVIAIASWLSYRFYETPARKLLNRLFERVWPRRSSNSVAADGGAVDASQSEALTLNEATHPRQGPEPAVRP